MEGCMGEESFQMWELNRRLEAYLARVKALEEQNELLSAELGGLRAQSADTSWRARADDELAALRALVDQRWREKHAAEVARDNLAEELEGVAGRCQQLRLARERTTEEVARNRRAVEAEKCARAWLSSQAAELERELEALRVAHEEERVGLNAQAACAPRCPAPPRGPPAPAPEVEELARRLGEAWRGAVRGYQERVAHMETSLGQARERLGRAVQGAREGRLELQQLQAERGGLQERRAALEQRLEDRWQERLRATEKHQSKFQVRGLQCHHGRQGQAHGYSCQRWLLCGSPHYPKLELQFPGTPEGRRLGSLLPVLSPTSLPSPLPATLETPVPAFLKNQEFLQARTPTLASTPIPPTPQAPSPAADAEIRAQDAPLSLLQTQGGRKQAPEPLRAEARVAIPASVLPGPEEPGGQQQEASTGQSPEDHASLAPPLSPDHSSLEAKDGESGGSRVFSICQGEGEGQIWGLVEKETAIEGKVVSSLQQEIWEEEDLNRKEIQDSQVPLEKETLKSLGEEIQESLKTLENQSHETLERENQECPRSLEEDLETLKSLEKENKELLKDVEVVRPLEKEAVGQLKPTGKEDTQTLQSLQKENQELMKSLEGNLETFLFPGKENQELVSSLQENLESLTALEKENQEPLRSPEVGDEEALRPLTKENQEPLRSLEDENKDAFRSLEKENQEPLKTLEEEDQSIVRPLETENHKSLRSLEEQDQETLRTLEKETQQRRRSLGEEDQMTLRPPEKVDPEPLKSLDQEIARPLENENQEFLKSLKEESVEAVKSLETEILESLKSAGQENLETLKSPETQAPLWTPEEINQGTMKPLEKEIQEPLESVEVNQETLRLLEEENQESLRSLGAWNLENLRSPEEVDKESQRNLEEEENLGKGEYQESLRSLEEEGQELPQSADVQRWEDTVEKDQELAQESPPGMAGVENEDEAELNLREQDGFTGKEEVVEQGELNATEEVWIPGEGHPESPEPKEQRGLVEGASVKGGAEGLQDPEGQSQQVVAPGLQAPQGLPEAIEPLVEDDVAPGGDQASPEVMLGSEPAMGESAAGAEPGPGQGVGGLEDPGHLTRGEVMEPPLEEESLEAKRVQGLEGPRKDLEEAGGLGTEFSELPGKSRDPWEPPKGREESEAEAPRGAEEAFPAETLGHTGSDAPSPWPLGSEEAEEDVPPVLVSPSPTYTPILEDAPGPQPQAEGSQEASWGVQGRAEALGKVESEQEELGSGEIPEGLQEEGEESREESEEDELGETLPDSTPLGFYLRSPTSPRWDPTGEQRPPPQGETGKEGWDPAVLASEGLEAPPSEKEEGEEGEEECGRDSDMSEEFEDLGTEAPFLPGVPGEVAEPLGQVPQLLLDPAAWDRDGESDGFADEEESGEEGEEDQEEGREPGAGRWGPGSSVGSLQALSSSQRGEFLESDSVSVSVPWDDSLRGAVAGAPKTALETESQDSAEPSGSEEESDPVSLEREDKVPGPLEIPSGMEDAGPGADIIGVNGQGPNLEGKSQHVNGGVMNGLEQSEEVGQGMPLVSEGDRGSPFQEEEGSALKTSWAGAPVHLGQGQFLKFTQREGDRESWSSGED
uniref:Nestin n=1 Tax=Pan paniscus TaxID=9597 RepID=A0A2R9B9P6_PANPA